MCVCDFTCALSQESDIERDSEADYGVNSDSAASDYGGEKKKKKKHKDKKEKKTKKKKKEDDDSTHEETTKVRLYFVVLCLFGCSDCGVIFCHFFLSSYLKT